MSNPFPPFVFIYLSIYLKKKWGVDGQTNKQANAQTNLLGIDSGDAPTELVTETLLLNHVA